MVIELAVLVVALATVASIARAIHRGSPRAVVTARLARGATQLEDHAIVTVTGIVVARETMEAPLSGRACVLYEAYAKVLDRNGRRRLFYGEVIERLMVTFALETSEGVVIVDGRRAETSFSRAPLIPRDIDREVRFLKARGKRPELARMSTFEELVIEPGARVAVQGMVIVDRTAGGDNEVGYREGVSRVRLVAYEHHPLSIGPPRRMAVVRDS